MLTSVAVAITPRSVRVTWGLLGKRKGSSYEDTYTSLPRKQIQEQKTFIDSSSDLVARGSSASRPAACVGESIYPRSPEGVRSSRGMSETGTKQAAQRCG